MTYLLALDQGTSSCRSIVFDPSGQTVAMAQKELTQMYPQPGWVEHDALEIWRLQLATAREALASFLNDAGKRGWRCVRVRSWTGRTGSGRLRRIGPIPGTKLNGCGNWATRSTGWWAST